MITIRYRVTGRPGRDPPSGRQESPESPSSGPTYTVAPVTGSAADPVLIRAENYLGHITLNRPRQINALTLEMIHAVQAALASWVDDPRIAVVLIDGVGDRGLCAGGDIRLLYQGLTGAAPAPAEFWTDEYRMNSTLGHYPKPIVSYMTGITLGGGVGIAAHCRVRIVTESSRVGMPETAIGLSPDVGGLYLLSRSPGEVGTHAALTGARLGPADAIAAGLARWNPATLDQVTGADVAAFFEPLDGHPLDYQSLDRQSVDTSR